MWLGLHFPTWPQDNPLDVLKDQVASIAYGYSDHLSWINNATLILEIKHSLALYKNAFSLIKQLISSIQAVEEKVQYGVAPNATAAELISRQGITCWDQKYLEQALNTLPIVCLPIDDKTQDALASCGLTTLGALKAQPSHQRIRRFGIECHQYLQRLYGDIPTLIKKWRPDIDYYDRIEPLQPIENIQRLGKHIQASLNKLGSWLIQHDRALDILVIRAQHESRNHIALKDLVIRVGLSQPTTDINYLIRLIELKLENISIQAPLTKLIIQCQSNIIHAPSQPDLIDGRNRQQSWHQLMDFLAMRLGHDALSGIKSLPHHQPEKSWSWTHCGDSTSISEDRPRPTWLFSEPTPCDREKLRLQQGPERIETDWWGKTFCQRDYWVALEPSGRQLWVFCEHQPRTGWFVHGIFG